MTVVYLKFLDGLLYSAYTPLSGAEGADDGESFMWWESWQSL